MNFKIAFAVCICMLIFFSFPAMAEFEVPEGAITFESLGISGTYDDNATKSQTKEVTLHFSHQNEVKIV